MEEIRSTKVIDDEILSQASKKAAQILNDADEETKKLFDSIDDKVQIELKDKIKDYSQKLESIKRNSDAILPLKKKRYKVFYVNEQIVKGINEYLSSISKEKRLQILIKRINCKKDFFAEKELNVFVYGTDKQMAEKEIKKLFPNQIKAINGTEFNKFIQEDDIGLSVNEGIILQTTDQSITAKFTLCEVIKNLLDTETENLANALFGNGGLD